MSTKWGFHCAKCKTSSEHLFNHGADACVEILNNWSHIKAIQQTAWLEINTLGNYGFELFPFIDKHFEHGLQIENEYGDILELKVAA